MLSSRSEDDAGFTRMSSELYSDDDRKATMMWAKPTRHPDEARMMVASRPRHGEAMITYIIRPNVRENNNGG
jgi:hypothetical protein